MASPAVELPDDVIYYNILPRLPYRSLRRLAAVCRAWRHIICRNAAFAALQAQNPAPASVAMARFRGGNLRFLTPGSEDVVPRDPSLGSVPADHRSLHLCATTGGVLCLMKRPYARGRTEFVSSFFVVNPATNKSRRVPYGDDAVTAGLAYDPETSPRDGFRLVVPEPTVEGDDACRRFRWVSSRRGGWRASKAAVTGLPPVEEWKAKPAYVDGRVHWLAERAVVWYDFADDRAGTTPLPASESAHGGHGLGAWHGRLRLACANTLGVWVWELVDEARWEMVHARMWEEMPGAIRAGSPVAVEMEAGGEVAVCVVVTAGHEDDDPTKRTSRRRVLLRYDVRIRAVAVLELGEEDKIGSLVDYHSSMAKLPPIGRIVPYSIAQLY